MAKIKSLTIKNFKKYIDQTFSFEFDHYLFIGENDAGKSTILEAMNILFNEEKVEKFNVNDSDKNVEISGQIEVEDEIIPIRKVFKKGAYKLDKDSSLNLDKISLNYILLSPLNVNAEEAIKKFTIAKTKEKLGHELIGHIESTLEECAKEIIDNIDPNLIVVNPDIETELSGETGVKLEKSFEFKLNSSGVPFESRGLGYRKNLLFALLTQSNYKNTIIAIDEIENSMSLNNAKCLLEKITGNFNQSFLTTHSTPILNINSSHEIYPIYDEKGCLCVAQMYERLGKIDDDKMLLLVEGITDCYWFRRVIGLLGLVHKYIVVPVNGKDSFKNFTSYYDSVGIAYKSISDGDAKTTFSIKRECIELYTPVDAINKIFKKDLDSISSNKNDFFNNDLKGIENKRAKRCIAAHVNEFLTLDNPLIEEVRTLLK